MRTVVRLTGMCPVFPPQKDPDGASMPLLLQYRLQNGEAASILEQKPMPQ
ncbi:hypothetical protein BCO26_1256 [Heyndrickxia coagulans 2-6]|nr:hypothetical protein BCO26_1256 [Heyndrickxia coagulans 2-6]